MENLKALCDNCESRFTANKLLPIKDVFARVAPGEPMPLGECPNCGALCHAVEAGRTYEVAGKSFSSRAKAEKYAKQIGKTGVRVPVYETTGA